MAAQHPYHHRYIFKFVAGVLILIGYASVVILKYGLKDGLLVTLMTWAFFVMCTPIADAGFLVDFPMRLATGVRMVYSESIVWAIAVLLTIIVATLNPVIFDKTVLLNFFAYILSHPLPYWGIILLSLLGTFLSLYIGDHVVGYIGDVIHHRHRRHIKLYALIVFASVIALALVLYNYLLWQLGVPLTTFL